MIQELSSVYEILMYKWLCLKELSIYPTHILKDLKFKNCAIYEETNLSRLFYNELLSQNIKVQFINNFDNINDFDCIIISDFKNYYTIEKNIPKHINVFSIREIIELSHYLNIELKKFNQIKDKCTIFFLRIPKIEVEVASKSMYETLCYSIDYDIDKHKNNPEYFKFIYEDVNEYSDEYINNVFTLPSVIKALNGETKHIDYNSKYLNVINGERYTPNQPEEYNNSIYLYGPCDIFGIGADDTRTISYYLQDLMPYSRVVNYGVVYGGGSRYFDRILNKEYNKNDVIIVEDSYSYFPLSCKKLMFQYVFNKFKDAGVIYCDMLNVFNKRTEDKPVFIDNGHISYRGYYLIAEYLYYNYLQKLNITLDQDFKQNINNRKTFNIEYFSKDLDEYIKYLKDNKIPNSDNKKIGAVIINANPFTKGHRYLIEEACKKVDYLYIFVLEENKSFFSFEDRFNIIKNNVSDLPNVQVIKSGKFIISTITFPEYFSKDALKEATIDPSLDVSIFAEHIAPVLNITTRFAGEEPFCNITRQYNNSMKNILPKYNIEFKIFKRKEINGSAISATKVRQYIIERDYNKLTELVPKPTLDYIKDMIDKNIL